MTTRLISALVVEAAKLYESGVATAEDIDLACKLGFGHAMGPLATADLTGVDILLHATSTYPCKPEELNLRLIPVLKAKFGVPVGYSGHEVGLQTTLAAVTLGACLIERHITLDRAMWGSDQAASIEPSGFSRLVRDVRVIEQALGDGVKRVYDSEIPIRKKLRRAPGATA